MLYYFIFERTGFNHSFFGFVYFELVIRIHPICLVFQLFFQNMYSFQTHCLEFCTAAVKLFARLCFPVRMIQIFKITYNIFIHNKNSFVFILLGKVANFFVSVADFGLMPTLTVCVIQNGRTPLLLLQLLLLKLPDGETTVYTVYNPC